MHKIIIDSSQKRKSGHFALSLSNIENINDIELDLNLIREKFNIYLGKNDFLLSMEYLALGEKLASYGNEIINNMKLNFYFKYIVFKDKISKKSILDCLDILKNINIFYSISYSLSNFLDFDINESIKIIKGIENNINLLELLKEKFEDNDYLSLIEIKELEKYLLEKKDDNLKKLKEVLITEVDNKIKNLKNTSNEERVNFICNFLKEEYKKEFFISKEFLYLINTQNEFENYYILSEISDKAYLLYRFNNAINISEKIIALYSDLIPRYLNLPSYNKLYVVNELLEYKEKYYNINEFMVNLNIIIDKLDSINRINFISV